MDGSANPHRFLDVLGPRTSCRSISWTKCRMCIACKASRSTTKHIEIIVRQSCGKSESKILAIRNSCRAVKSASSYSRKRTIAL